MNASSTTCGRRQVAIVWQPGSPRVVPIVLKSGLARRWPGNIQDVFDDAAEGTGEPLGEEKPQGGNGAGRGLTGGPPGLAPFIIFAAGKIFQK